VSDVCYFFAGGGTGGHIYPAVAIAEQIIKLEADAEIHFFVSTRSIDSQILSKTNFKYTQLPAQSFSIQPGKLISFCSSFLKSYAIAKGTIAESEKPIVIGVGGFVAAPVCLAGHKLKIPVALLNVDIVPGRANKIIARWADEIFVQFEDTTERFAKHKAKVSVLGCPLRNGFENPQPNRATEQLGLDRNKNVLLITGASSGSENINETVCLLLDRLADFADDWQLVHLAGFGNYDKVKEKYADAKIGYKVLRYFDDMADLLAAADLVIGRSGAVSVAEYAAAAVPSIFAGRQRTG
jgi:UDP-N-acetylglucosamine--N-acetylmuramyl-(pentapeptide) pyrophosphoryl-undecaprenol N-acetylglucosamine transferase